MTEISDQSRVRVSVAGRYGSHVWSWSRLRQVLADNERAEKEIEAALLERGSHFHDGLGAWFELVPDKEEPQ